MSWIIFALLSALFAALVAIFGKMGIGSIDTTLATTVRSAIMFGFLLIVSLFSGVFQNIKQIDSKSLGIIALSGIAGALSWLFYFYALKKGPASGVAALDRLSVVFVIFLAFLFLGENLTLKSVAGAILITIGAILFAL
ncbi:EamA family transporter [bacterium]|jgi:transporter family protein|nr:EamA family transporter [bacterium]